MPQRFWQAIAALLALVLLVIGGFTAVVFLSRTASQSPRPTATATPRSTPSPSPSGSAGASGPASPSGSPSGSPAESNGEPSPSEPPSGDPSPSPSEEPTPIGELTTVTFSVERIGLDDPARFGDRSRYLTFFTDGAGDVRAAISDTIGGSVRLCLFRGTPDDVRTTPLCFDGRKGFVRGVAPGPDRGQWTVRLDRLNRGTTPATTVTVTHRTRGPMIQFTGFRFQGTGDQQRNGLRAHIKARNDGSLALTGSWLVNDAPQTFDYRVRVRDLTAGSATVDETANGESVTSGGGLTADHEYQVDLRNTQAEAGAEAILAATISWP